VLRVASVKCSTFLVQDSVWLIPFTSRFNFNLKANWSTNLQRLFRMRKSSSPYASWPPWDWSHPPTVRSRRLAVVFSVNPRWRSRLRCNSRGRSMASYCIFVFRWVIRLIYSLKVSWHGLSNSIILIVYFRYF
jgi:hypothetical protein